MLLLAIDTAGPDCAAAVVRARSDSVEILARRSERLGRGHAERLMPMIEAVLDEADATFANLDRLAVTIGPGSFTGVRVGIAAARGLALALDIEAVGVGSLDALAFPVRRQQKKGTVAASLDARRGEIYALAQDLESGATLVEPAALHAEDLIVRISPSRRPLFLIGAGSPILAAALSRSSFTIVAAQEAPDIADVAMLGIHAEAGAPPAPLYSRGADAKPQAGKASERQ